MKLELPAISAEERTPLIEALLGIIRVQQDRLQQQEATIQQLRDEIALLKGQKPRPDIQPSLLEARPPKTTPPEGGKRPGSAKRPKTAELHIHQEVPLHNNAMESDIREYVKRRKVSGGTRNDAGRRCRDTFASLKKTCRKLGVRFWEYLQDRVRGLGKIARLADLIRQKAPQRIARESQAVPAP